MKIHTLRSGIVFANILAGSLVLLLSHSTDAQVAVDTAGDDAPNFTVEQNVQALGKKQADAHPLWKTLSWSDRLSRAAMFSRRVIQSLTIAATSTDSNPSAANFRGNLTIVKGPAGGALALQRQSNCSLSLHVGTYTFSLNPTITVTGTTANYEQTLHSSAGLASQGSVFANGCNEPTVDIGSRRGVYLGKTSQNLYMFAGSGYNYANGTDALYYGTVDSSTLAVRSFKTDFSVTGLAAVAAGDLNGDGLADIVGIDQNSATAAVWLTNADGTIGSATQYGLSGTTTEAAVTTDINGDGKVDVVVATRDNSTSQERITVLTGRGDGGLNIGQPFAIATPAGGYSFQIRNLIAVDLRGNGRKDIVASNGMVLLNNGDGSFTTVTAAFPAVFSTSSFTPAIAAADFNKDGKADVALSNGSAVSLYLGKGDGTFTAGKSYASIDNVGYVTATDLDGDGNVDLFIGLANGGFFGGDQFEVNQVYALMGNGDGSFQGAPALPFVYTGTNLTDLNGDGFLDAVVVNTDLSFTSYLGDGQGGFTAKSALSTTPVTLSGSQYTVNNIDSYTLADVNGDGVADLLYIGKNFYGPGYTPGVFIALGNGQGGFAAPSFASTPSFLTVGDIDVNPTIANVRAADLNRDGKADLVYTYNDYSYNGHGYSVGTAVQLGNGNGTFQSPQTIPFYNGTTSIFQTSPVVAIADLNKDNFSDLVLMPQSFTKNSNNQYPFSVQVALGNGTGGFGTPATVATADLLPVSMLYGTQYAPLSIADMNGDGNPDLVVLGSSSTGSMQIAIALGNGNGTFKTPNKVTYGVQHLIGDALTVADFNGDGKLDIATGGFLGSLDSGITYGNGDGTLQTTTATWGTAHSELIYVNVNGAAIATDFNGDGKADVLVGNTLLLKQAASVANPDFTLTASSSSGTAAAGGTVQTTLTLTPSNGFNQSVSLSCSGLPASASCSFSPASVTVNGSASTSTLTISTTARTAMSSSPFNPLLPGGVLFAGLCTPMLLRRRHAARERRYGAWIVLLMAAMALHGCGGGGGGDSGTSSSSGSSSGGGTTTGGSSGTPAGSYTITVTATGGSTVHTVSYALTVS